MENTNSNSNDPIIEYESLPPAKQSGNNTLTIILALIVVALIVYGAYAYIKKKWPFSKKECVKSNIVSCAYNKYYKKCPTECGKVYPAVSTKQNYCLTILNDVISNQSKYFKTPSSKYAFMRYGTEPYMVKRSDDKIEFILYNMNEQDTDISSMGLVDGEPTQTWLDTWSNLYKTDSPECRMVHIFANGLTNTPADIWNMVQGNYFKYFDKVTDTIFYASAFGSIHKIEMVM